jgi:hypothetical protein
MTFDDIRNSKTLSERFRRAFVNTLESVGEVLLPGTRTKHIISVFEKQGYWSGCRYNICFSFEFGFEYEERRFGK